MKSALKRVTGSVARTITGGEDNHARERSGLRSRRQEVAMSRADGRGGIGLFRSKIGSRGSVGKVGGAHLPNAARLHCLASLCSDECKNC